MVCPLTRPEYCKSDFRASMLSRPPQPWNGVMKTVLTALHQTLIPSESVNVRASRKEFRIRAYWHGWESEIIGSGRCEPSQGVDLLHMRSTCTTANYRSGCITRSKLERPPSRTASSSRTPGQPAFAECVHTNDGPRRIHGLTIGGRSQSWLRGRQRRWRNGAVVPGNGLRIVRAGRRLCRLLTTATYSLS